MYNEEIDESPYCEACGTCGCIGCCGIRNFISEHIEGKTNCKNEGWIIQELINLCEYKDEVFKENKRLKRENKIMENYLQLIIDIGYDYDGYNDVEGLKNIIDELVQYASLGKNKNDKKSMSIDGNNKRYNILGEELKEGE